jgi:hypothetical protein
MRSREKVFGPGAAGAVPKGRRQMPVLAVAGFCGSGLVVSWGFLYGLLAKRIRL